MLCFGSLSTLLTVQDQSHSEASPSRSRHSEWTSSLAHTGCNKLPLICFGCASTLLSVQDQSQSSPIEPVSLDIYISLVPLRPHTYQSVNLSANATHVRVHSIARPPTQATHKYVGRTLHTTKAYGHRERELVWQDAYYSLGNAKCSRRIQKLA